MKKLVVLALVLAISGVASAALTLGVAGGTGVAGAIMPGDVLTLSISNDNAAQLANSGIILAIDGAVAFDISTATSIVPDGVMDFTGGFPGEIAIFADCAKPTTAAPWFEIMPVGVVVNGVKITAGAAGSTIFIRNTDEAATPDAGQYAPVTLTVSDVPEPMTLGLLGLGGLFLRRRLA